MDLQTENGTTSENNDYFNEQEKYHEESSKDYAEQYDGENDETDNKDTSEHATQGPR
jgi:hypothetical protein